MKENVEAERWRLQLSKEAVCKELGIIYKTYMGYIRDERSIPSDKLEAMSKLFDCSIDYLLGWTNNRKRAS
ncbi:MAG: helix-turn-helix transcriptional regulator [Oscillospiraceae bacterium]